MSSIRIGQNRQLREFSPILPTEPRIARWPRSGRWRIPGVDTSCVVSDWSAENVMVWGGIQALSSHNWKLTVPVMVAPSALLFFLSGADHRTFPACSSTTSPSQPGTPSIVFLVGGGFAVKGEVGKSADVGSIVIFVGLGPPGF